MLSSSLTAVMKLFQFKFISIVHILLTLISEVSCANEYVRFYVTKLDENDKFHRFCDLSVQTATSDDILKDADVAFTLTNETQNLQPIYGYGAALTQSSAYLLTQMKKNSNTNYWALLNELFSKSVYTDTGNVNDGVDNYRVLRLPISASDYVIDNFYTYDHVKYDYNLSHINISIDDDFIIPRLLDILSIKSDIQIMASTWSPPAWYKTSFNLSYPYTFTQGSFVNNSNKTYETYAKYLVKILELYKTEYNISITHLSIQNEPLHCGDDWPACCMSPEQQIILSKIIGQKLAKNKHTKDVKLVIFDHNWSEMWYPMQVLNNSEANKYISGSAWHCYDGDVTNQSIVHNAYPDKEIYFSECTSFNNTDFYWDLQWDVNRVYMGAIQNWATMVS